MNKSTNSPIIYDFFSKSLKDMAYTKRNQSSETNFKGAPAEVVGVEDYETYQCLDVKVSINDIYVERDNLVLESITLKKVFVALPRSGGWSIKQPVALGDLVRLHWSHRDLGDYLDGDGSPVDVNVSEIAQIEDCWIELGFGTRKNNTKPSLKDFIIEGPKTTITITPEGDYTMVNNATTVHIDPSGNVSLVTNGTSSVTSSAHTVTAPTTINGTLTVTGLVNFLNNLGVAGNTDVIGALTTAGATVTAHDHNGQVPPMS